MPLNSLLKRELQLQEKIDKLQKEINQLEKKVDYNNQDLVSKKLTKNELKQFKAPEWCIPIKANVMTFEWDVCVCVCVFAHIVL